PPIMLPVSDSRFISSRLCLSLSLLLLSFFSFFSHHTSPTSFSSLSLHDALPILLPSIPDRRSPPAPRCGHVRATQRYRRPPPISDRKSTRLNSSHQIISYAVFCLKKKKKIKKQTRIKSQSTARRNISHIASGSI